MSGADVAHPRYNHMMIHFFLRETAAGLALLRAGAVREHFESCAVDEDPTECGLWREVRCGHGRFGADVTLAAVHALASESRFQVTEDVRRRVSEQWLAVAPGGQLEWQLERLAGARDAVLAALRAPGASPAAAVAAAAAVARALEPARPPLVSCAVRDTPHCLAVAR
jgi:hypothetical protein